MKMLLKKSRLIPGQSIQICGSKSISNRLLILNALFSNIRIENLSDSDDTRLLSEALQSDAEVIDIGHAGTAMRFLISYFSVLPGKKTILTGSARMKERPVAFLVDALRELGAEIDYLEQEGFPPLRITGKKIVKSNVSIPGTVSSQFISSLLLIGAKLPNGLNIEITGEITSRPYLEMTVGVIKRAGIEVNFTGNKISVRPLTFNGNNSNLLFFEVESDWSSASYFYSLAAIGRENIHLKSFNNHSLQGDSRLKEIFWENFRVNTVTDIQEHQISIVPEAPDYPEKIELNLNDCPDIAQTVCATAAALKIPFEITGLATLKLKETDRLEALKNELIKIGCHVETEASSIKSTSFTDPQENIEIDTYDDHRMAMSFAPFSLLHDLEIINPDVVEKSYPNFWRDLSAVTEHQ